MSYTSPSRHPVPRETKEEAADRLNKTERVGEKEAERQITRQRETDTERRQ